MQDYNFDEIIARRHTNSYKWDTPAADDVIPMWVADMDFRTAPCIIEALRRRVDHGVFGYTKVPESYYRAIIHWFERRHGWRIERSQIIYTIGVVPAISAILQGLTRRGDGVIVQTPAYNCFYSSIRNTGCRLEPNPLIYHAADGSYSIDFADLEQRAARPDVSAMLLCNPHNPAGRVWSVDELTRIAEICHRHNVVVISDEIHCELTYAPYRFHPFAPIAERVGTSYVVTNSPSKSFNIAGLQIANIITPDEDMRAKIDRAINDNEVCDVNPFGVTALIAAYTQGEGWLNALTHYLQSNYLYARRFFDTELPLYTVTPLEGTYLMWINIAATGMTSEEVCRRLEEGGVMLSPGSIYGPGGDDFVRLNLATPRTMLDEGLRRIAKVLGPLANA